MESREYRNGYISFATIKQDKAVNVAWSYDAMKIFVDKMMKLKISTVTLLPEINEHRLHPQTGKIKPVIYRILPLEKSGRFETGSI